MCKISMDGEDGATTCCWRDQEPEENVVGKRRVELVQMAVGRGEGGGGDGCTPVSGGRHAGLLARIGVGRRSDGLHIIALALVSAASQR